MAQAKRAGTNSDKKASPIRMEFTEDQKDVLQSFIATEVRNKMIADKMKQLTKAVEELTEEDGWNLRSRMGQITKSDAFLIEEPMPELDANHVDGHGEYV